MRRSIEVHVAGHGAINQRNEGRADEHVPQADTKKQAILIDPSATESGPVQRIIDERVGQNRYALVQPIRGKLFDDDRHVRLRVLLRGFALA
jgi:hypothetical protein